MSNDAVVSVFEFPPADHEGEIYECNIHGGFDFKTHDEHLDYLGMFEDNTDFSFELFKRDSEGMSLSKDSRGIFLNALFYMKEGGHADPVFISRSKRNNRERHNVYIKKYIEMNIYLQTNMVIAFQKAVDMGVRG